MEDNIMKKNKPALMFKDQSEYLTIKLFGVILAFFMVCFSVNISAADKNTGAKGTQTLDAKVQDLKKEVKSLNRDLFILEEELLFPSSTQLAVFLSVDVGNFFRLDSVQLKIDNKVVANHLYTKRELGALERGGVQRLYVGNVKSGEHELIAIFSGPGPNNREYRRGTTLKFNKSSAAKFLELKIVDSTGKLQPEFSVKEWE